MAAAEGLGSETFSFTGGDPLPSDEQSRLGSDLDLFGKLSTEQSAEIADLVFDFLHDPSVSTEHRTINLDHMYVHQSLKRSKLLSTVVHRAKISLPQLRTCLGR